MTAGSCNCSACWRGLSKHNKGSFWFSEYFDMRRDDDRSSGTPVCIPIWHLCTSQCGVTRWPRGQYYACPQFLGCYPWCYASGSSLSSFDIRGLFVLFSFLSMFAVLDALLQCFGILWRLVENFHASFIVFQLNLSCLEFFLFCFVFCVMIDSRINRGLHLCFGNFQFNCNDLFWFSSYEVWNIEFFKSFYNAVLRSESWRKVWSCLCLLTVSLSVLCAVCANVSWLCSIQWWKPGSSPAIPSENIRSTRTRNGELTEIKKSFHSEYQAGD